MASYEQDATHAEGAPAGTGLVASDAPPLQAVIKNVDMAPEMQTTAIALADESLRTYTLEKDMAAFTKKRLDALFGPTWQSIVGKKFGSYVTHEVRHFIYFCA